MLSPGSYKGACMQAASLYSGQLAQHATSRKLMIQDVSVWVEDPAQEK